MTYISTSATVNWWKMSDRLPKEIAAATTEIASAVAIAIGILLFNITNPWVIVVMLVGFAALDILRFVTVRLIREYRQ